MIPCPVASASRLLGQGALLHALRCRRSYAMDKGKGKGKPSVYVTRGDVPPSAIKMLTDRYDVEIWSKTTPVPRDEIMKKVKGKDALFCLLTDKIDKELLDSAGSSLKVIGTMSVGFDHVDLPEVKKRNIKIGFTPEVLTDAVADLTIALLLATSRRLIEAHKEIFTGGWGPWSPMWMCGPSLKGSTVGIVGFGRIGKAVAHRLSAFGIERLVYTVREKDDSECSLPLDELLAVSDFVIVLCALTPETKDLFNDDKFCKMKPTAVFINTSRGGVVDQDALLRALKCGTIHAAGLDVTTPEPLPPDHPLLQLKNCVIIPHIGSATNETRTEMAELTSRNIIAGLEGKPMPRELK